MKILFLVSFVPDDLHCWVPESETAFILMARSEHFTWKSCIFSRDEFSRLLQVVGGRGIDGGMKTVTDFIFWATKSLQMVTATMKLKDTCSLEEKL